jgi:hypothetical protein
LVQIDCFANSATYCADSSPFGHSYGQWTAKWWQWFLSNRNSNCTTDDSLDYRKDLGLEKVCFLCGKVADSLDSYPHWTYRIPHDYSVLFPVITCEANYSECPELSTSEELIEYVKTDEDTIVQKVCTLDGRPLLAERVRSDPIIFELDIHMYNAFNVKPGKTHATSDGYWIFLRPLTRGAHNLRFRGKCEQGKLKTGADYLLQIV